MKLSYFLWYRWNKKNRRFRKLLKEKWIKPWMYSIIERRY
jgi:hypothetical protein